MFNELLYEKLQVTLNVSFSLQGLSSVLGEFQIPLTKIADLKNVFSMYAFLYKYLQLLLRVFDFQILLI